MSIAAAGATHARERAGARTPDPPAPAPGHALDAGLDAGTSLLAESLASVTSGTGVGQRAAAAAPPGDRATEVLLSEATLRLSRLGEGAPRLAPPGSAGRWIGHPSAAAHRPLLDLQRLAGNAAVTAGLGAGPVPRRERPGQGLGGAAVPVQRIEIPGLGEIDVGGIISRAMSMLGPAEQSRDRARDDAKTQAADAGKATDQQIESGKHDLDASKDAAQQAGEAMNAETQAATDAAASAEQDKTIAGNAHGDRVADDIRGLEPSVEHLVDPLAEVGGSTEAGAGHQALDEAAEHAVSPEGALDGSAGPGQAPATIDHAPASADHAPVPGDHAVPSGPGPPGPAPAPGPSHTAGTAAPGSGESPAATTSGEDHAVPPAGPAGTAASAGTAPPAPAPAGPAGLGSGGPAPGPSPPGPAGPLGQHPDFGVGEATAAPTCALVEAVKNVEGWKDKARTLASRAVDTIGNALLPGLWPSVKRLAGVAGKAATWVAKGVKRIRDGAVALGKKVGSLVKSGISTAAKAAKEGFKAGATYVKSLLNQARSAVSAAWELARSGISAGIAGIRDRAKRLARAAMDGIRKLVGTLPKSVQNLLGAVGDRIRSLLGEDPLGDAAATLRSILDVAKQGLRTAKDTAKTLVKGGIEGAKDVAKRKIDEAKATAKIVIEGAKKVAPYVAATTAPSVTGIAALAKSAGQGFGKQLREGAAKVAKAIKGEACEQIGETVGPCLDMYLPDPKKGEKGFAKLTGQADLTVPLHEFDVPCNVKVGRGASVTVDRSSSGYGVAVEGESVILANLAQGKEGAEVKFESPSGGGMAAVWEKLGGGATPKIAGVPTGGSPAPSSPAGSPAPAPGAAAPGSGAPAPAPGQGGSGGGPELSGEVEAGLKGSTSLKFSFPISGGTTCQGAGGVASLLGALGVAAALPSPLDTIAQSGVVGSWQGNLVSHTVTLAGVAGGQFELAGEGLGALKGQGQVETYVTSGAERPDQSKLDVGAGAAPGAQSGSSGDSGQTGPFTKPASPPDPNALRPVIKVGTSIKGEGSAELAPMGLLAKAGASAAGRLEALLVFDRPSERIVLQSVTASGEFGLSVGGINPAIVAAQLGPPYGPAASAAITRLGLAHSNGSVKASFTSTANNLQRYIEVVSGYLAGGPSSVSAAGLSSAVKGAYKPDDFSTSVQVTATVSDRLGLEAKAETFPGDGAKLGASAKASVEVGKEYQLYPSS